MIKKRNILVVSYALMAILFVGCSKNIDEYNKPALYWYGKIISSISDGDYDKADDYYSSLQGEHIGSPLLPEATMMLAIAHMHDEEYLLSQHFLNEYIKRYANANEREFAEYLKVKAKYKSLSEPRRDQLFVREAIYYAQLFERQYPDSNYYPLVDTMLTRLYITERSFNESIANLYSRIDKPKAAKYYRDLNSQPWINYKKVEPASTPWYKRWFEGDGTSSWYEFLIPDTKSVVSRNSISDENLTK